MTGISNRLVALSALGMVVPLVSCGAADSNAQSETASDTVSAPAARVINVEVERVTPGEFTDYIRITGEAEAFFDVTISAEESGVVREFAVERGTFVRSGDPIVRLDDAVLSAQVAEARAAAELSHEQFDRQRQLWEEDSVGSELAYLESRYQSQIAQARLNQLEARLAKTLVRSPVDGVFDERFVDVGEMAAPGTPLVRVVQTSRIKVSGGVPERDSRYVSVGDTALVTFDVVPERELVGRINYVGTRVDEASRTFPIEVVLDNPGRLIKPNMVADVQVMRESSAGVITVPQQVVLRSSNGYQVYVARRDGDRYRAHARDVVVGRSYNNHVLIQSGLDDGDLLITLGQQLVDEGSLLHIVNETDATGVEEEE